MPTRIAILGTGLIGSSIGLALHRRGDDLEIVGFDRYSSAANQAKKVGAVDRTANHPADAVRDARLVILAAPVLANHRLLGEIGDALDPDTVVTDAGSTKSETMRHARESLPRGVHFIGGHPMAGKTETGAQHADAELFQGSRWVIVAPTGAPESAVSTVVNLAEVCGAEPMYMDADEHDAYVAAVSHLPMMLATALFRMARSSEAWPELSLLAAGGFKGTTRLVGTDPAMAYDISVTNREHILHWIDRFRGALLDVRDLLADEEGDEELFKMIAQSEFEYATYLNGKVGRDADSGMAEVGGFDFGSFLMGEVIREKMREVTRDAEERVERLERERRLRREV